MGRPRQDACHKGHQFTPENTYEHNGNRQCRKCRLERQKQHIRRLREAYRQLHGTECPVPVPDTHKEDAA